MEQVGVEVGGVEFIVEAAQTGQNLFTEFRLERTVQGSAEKNTAATRAELTKGAVGIYLKWASTIGEIISIIGMGCMIRGLFWLYQVKHLEGGDIESVAVVREAAALAATVTVRIGGF